MSTTPQKMNSSSTCQTHLTAMCNSFFLMKKDLSPPHPSLSTRLPLSPHTMWTPMLRTVMTLETLTTSQAPTPPSSMRRRRINAAWQDLSPIRSPLFLWRVMAHGIRWFTTRTDSYLTFPTCLTITIPLMYDSQTRHVGGRPSWSLSTIDSRYVSATCRQCNGLTNLADCTCISDYRCDLEYHTLCREGLNLYYTLSDLTKPLWVHDRK